MPSLNDNDVKIKVSSQADNKGLDDTSKALDNLSKHSSSAGGAFGSLGGIAVGTAKAVAAVAVAVGAAAVTAGTFAVKSAADFQQTRIGLENMLGSAEKARSVLGEVSDFAASTPFEFPELANSVKQLIAFGFSAEDGIATMKQLGDVSAAIGAPIGDLSYLMGTLRTQGRAFTVDIRQFAQRGIPIYEYLAKVLKTDEQAISGMIEAGKIGFPEVQKAFTLMTDEGGLFHGTMEKQSKSLTGLWSTLSDNIGFAAREIIGINKMGDIRSGSVFEYLVKGVSSVNEVLGKINWTDVVKEATDKLMEMYNAVKDVAIKVGDYLVPKFKDLWTSLNDNVIPALKDLWINVIEPLIPVLGTTLVVAIGAVTDALKFVIDGVAGLVKGFQDGNPIIIGLAGAFGTLAAAMAFNAVFTALSTGFATLSLVTIPTVMASITALKASILTPIIMPAIAIGLALGAIRFLFDEYWRNVYAMEAENRNNPYLNGSNNAGAPVTVSDGHGGSVDTFHYASGTNSAPGGMALVGENGPEYVDIPRGSKVYTNKQSGNMNGGNTFTFTGNIILGNGGAVTTFFDKLDQESLIASKGLTPSRGF